MDAAPLLYATIIVAALLAVYLIMQSRGKPPHGAKSHFNGDVPPTYHQEVQSLRAGRQKVLDAVRGKPDAAARHDALLSKFKLDQRQGARIRVEDLAEAERAVWNAAHDGDGTATYDPVAGSSAAGDSIQYHSKGPAIDYDGYIAELIMDDRTRENHAKWVQEMRPWSGAIHNVDTFSAGDYLDWRGLRRPAPVTQVSNLFVTEVGPDDLASNRKFNFMG